MKDSPLNRTKVLRGEQLPQSKLTDSDVRMIRELVEYRERLKREASQLTNRRIAEKFGLHVRTIDRITAYEAWTHVT